MQHCMKVRRFEPINDEWGTDADSIVQSNKHRQCTVYGGDMQHFM